MPKKQPKNAFYYFMLDYKDDQHQKGIHYSNMLELAEAASAPWQNTPESVKAKYQARAKNEKQNLRGGHNKFTAQGVPLSHIEQQQKEAEDMEAAERQDIIALVSSNIYSTESISRREFYLMDVNYYCKAAGRYLIGECTILRFSVENGIMDTYHELINPGTIPVGYASDVKLGCKEYGLLMPDPSDKSDYMRILANIIDYLKQQKFKGNVLPPLFTMPEKVEPVYDFILQLCYKAAEDETLFRVYKLDYLFYTLLNALKKDKQDDVMPKESLALSLLRQEKFKYTPHQACEHHTVPADVDEEDRSTECSTARVKCWALSVLDRACPVAGVRMLPGEHLPYGLDLEGINIYKEQKKVRSAPSVAAASYSVYAASNSSMMSDSLADTTINSSFDVGVPKKEKRTHQPLRMPKTDYSQSFNAAPDLSEINFPALSLGSGRGRGRKNH